MQRSCDHQPKTNIQTNFNHEIKIEVLHKKTVTFIPTEKMKPFHNKEYENASYENINYIDKGQHVYYLHVI